MFSACTKISNERQVAITTDDVVINNTQITAKGTLIDLGENLIHSYGFCWSLSPIPTLNDNVLSFMSPAQTGAFSGTIANVSPNLTYYIRAFASNGPNGGVVYGEQLMFTPTADGLQVVTDTITFLSTSSVSLTGHIHNVGSLCLQEFGVFWGTTILPSDPVYLIPLGSLAHDTTFACTISGLSIGVPYYARTMARLNNDQTIMANVIQFTIPDLVVTTDTFAINGSSANLYGSIVCLGVPAVTQHGFCWSVTTSYPSVNNKIIELGSTTQLGAFSGNLPALVPGTTIYFRAYATDGDYIKYGQIKHFTP